MVSHQVCEVLRRSGERVDVRVWIDQDQAFEVLVQRGNQSTVHDGESLPESTDFMRVEFMVTEFMVTEFMVTEFMVTEFMVTVQTMIGRRWFAVFSQGRLHNGSSGAGCLDWGLPRK